MKRLLNWINPEPVNVKVTGLDENYNVKTEIITVYPPNLWQRIVRFVKDQNP